MSPETQNNKSRSLHIGKGVEISIGQTVPVLEHPKCVGLWGKISAVNVENQTYNATCNTCGNDVIVDIKLLTA